MEPTEQTARTIPNNKPDITVSDNEKEHAVNIHSSTSVLGLVLTLLLLFSLLLLLLLLLVVVVVVVVVVSLRPPVLSDLPPAVCFTRCPP